MSDLRCLCVPLIHLYARHRTYDNLHHHMSFDSQVLLYTIVDAFHFSPQVFPYRDIPPSTRIMTTQFRFGTDGSHVVEVFKDLVKGKTCK